MPTATVVDALVSAVVWMALPLVGVMAVWAGVMAVRILRPERPLPFDGPARRERARAQGQVRTVSARQILDDEARRHVRSREAADGVPSRLPTWADDLWLRRN